MIWNILIAFSFLFVGKRVEVSFAYFVKTISARRESEKIFLH